MGTTVFSLVFAVALMGFELATFELLIVYVQLSHALTAWNIMQCNAYIKMSVSGLPPPPFMHYMGIIEPGDGFRENEGTSCRG